MICVPNKVIIRHSSNKKLLVLEKDDLNNFIMDKILIYKGSEIVKEKYVLKNLNKKNKIYVGKVLNGCGIFNTGELVFVSDILCDISEIENHQSIRIAL